MSTDRSLARGFSANPLAVRAVTPKPSWEARFFVFGNEKKEGNFAIWGIPAAIPKSNREQRERGCGQKVGHSGVRIGVRMYPLETRELAVEAVAAGFSLTEAAELAGCSRTAVVN